MLTQAEKREHREKIKRAIKAALDNSDDWIQLAAVTYAAGYLAGETDAKAKRKDK